MLMEAIEPVQVEPAIWHDIMKVYELATSFVVSGTLTAMSVLMIDDYQSTPAILD